MENKLESMSVNEFMDMMGIKTLKFRRPKKEEDREKLYAIFTYEDENVIVGTTTKGTLRADIVKNTIKHSELQIVKLPEGNYVMCYQDAGVLASVNYG
jgi:hypothetical protein